MPSGVSPGWITRAVMPSAQLDAVTNRASERASCFDQSACDSLSSIKRSAVAPSGTRNKASANTISAKPSLVDKEYSRKKSSMPPRPLLGARIASISLVARASMRASDAPGKLKFDIKSVAIFSSAAANSALNDFNFISRRNNCANAHVYCEFRNHMI